MFDPILSLAFSIHSNRGVYALLLGSGVSRSAGFPTGWEIVLDLARKIAHVKGEDCEPDPAAWYTRTFGKEPDYSELLDELARSPTERSGLLRSYFEPTEEERDRGAKVPTDAHKAIADLVAKGYVRVILTTNFDRLLESALHAVGVSPTVISTPDAAEGAIPLIHLRCTVMKLHGDYLDTRIKNTPAELSTYDPRVDVLLDRVFDEFGLLVCGWSAEWDTALRAAMERCKSRRFCTYWTTRSEPGEASSRLIGFRGAQVITIVSADAFFRQVREHVVALETFDRPHPLSARVAVANLKRYIAEDRHKILLRDLVAEETERVYSKITGADFATQDVEPNAETIPARAASYEAVTDILLQLVIHGCYWGEKHHEGLWIRAIERLTNLEIVSGYQDWLDMRRYPAMLLLYGGGLAALSSSRHETVMGLLMRAQLVENGKERPASVILHPFEIMNQKAGQMLPGMERRRTPLNDHVRDLLLQELKDLVPREDEYDRLFDRFEYIDALVIADFRIRKDMGFWFPVGRFGWRGRSHGRHISTEVGEEIDKHRAEWPFLKAGLCGGSLERLRELKSVVDEHVKKLGWWY